MAKSTKNEVATLLPTTDLINQINVQLNKLKAVSESVYITKKKFSLFDIENEKEISNLIRAYGELIAREQIYDKSAQELGINQYPQFKVEGSSVSDWKKDILLRIEIIKYKDKLDELNSLKKEAEELMDKEDRKRLLQDKMERVLNS